MKRHSASRSIETQQNELNERKKAKINENKAVASDDKPTDDLKTGVSAPLDELKTTNGDFHAKQTDSDDACVKRSAHNAQNGVESMSIEHVFEISPEGPAENEKDLCNGPENGDAAETANDSDNADLRETSSGNVTPDDSFCTSIDSESETVNALVEIDQNGGNIASLTEGTEEQVSNSSIGSFEPEYFLTSLLQTSELTGHAESVTSVAVDEEIIVSASEDTTIKIWDPVKKTEVTNLQGHSGSVNALVLLSVEQSAKFYEKLNMNETSKIVISASTDCSVRLWSVEKGLELLFLYTYNGINCLDYFSDSCYVVVGTDGGKVEVWDLSSLKVVHSVLAHDDAVTDIKVDEDYYVYTCSGDGKVRVWVFEDGELQIQYTRNRKQTIRRQSSLESNVWHCLTSHDGKIYLGDDTLSLKVLDWKEGKLNAHKNSEGCITSMYAKKNYLLTSSYNRRSDRGSINVWNLPETSYVCTMSGKIGRICSTAASETADGIVRLVSGGEKLLIWDFIVHQKASPKADDEYFCSEMRKTSDDEDETDAVSSSSTDTSNHTDKKRSFRCSIM